jgi:formylglycine-generating enzyme required for sulfatase activity/energy-coupling factor transporter ATP-binding protein EcfA2
MLMLDDERRILLDILARLFKQREKFATFLRDELDKNLDEIARQGGNLKDTRSDVVKNAQDQGWTRDLIEALYRQNVPTVTTQLQQIGTVEELQIGPSGPSRNWQLRYFEQVEDELGNLRPAIPPRVAPRRAALPRQQWPLLQVFVPLELLSSRGRIEGELDWSKLIKGDRVVLIGGPGSGKSTLLRHLALTTIDHRRKQLTLKAKSAAAGAGATTDALSRIPVWTNLPRAVLQIQQGLGTVPRSRWYKNLTAELWLEPLAAVTHLRNGEEARALLETGEVLLIFDGLDEIADPQARLALAEIISKLPKAFGGLEVKNPVVVACREKAWEGGGAFAPFEQARIQPMDRTKWQRYLDRWCRAVWEDDAEKVLDRLGAALRSSREVEMMAANPQTATMLAVLAREADLPHQRVRLYDQYLKFALTNDRMNGYGDADQVRGYLIALAVEAQHATGPGGEPRDGISEKRTRQILGARLLPSGAYQRSDEELCRAGETLLNDLELHTGLVSVQHTDDPSSVSSIVSFTHRTMQEFLVACHYVSHPEEMLEHARDRSWLVPIALTSAMLAKNAAFDALERFLGKLAREPPDGATRHEDLVDWGERLAVLSECLEELSSWKVPQKTLDPARAAYSRIETHLEGCAPRERVAIAEGMGILGDPRLAPGKASRWVEIAACSSLVGSDSDEAWIQESPARTVYLSSYWVQRWPVLVSEYARFVEARGYSDDQWWDTPGARWRAEARVEAPEGWERMLPFSNRPVTGISWWEARAYARWLTTVETLPEGWFVTLPTEAQWERAARGPFGSPIHADGRFPWGTEWNRDHPRASCGRILEGPCPVGLFPAGHSPEMIWDLAGNVGERCVEGFGPPDISENTEREAPRDPCHFDHKFGHTVRGGDWASPVLNARVSARFSDSLSERSDRIGFRCVAWSAPMELR